MAFGCRGPPMLLPADLTPGGEGLARRRAREKGGVGGIRAQVVRQRSFLESRVWGQMELDGGVAEGAFLVKQIF